MLRSMPPRNIALPTRLILTVRMCLLCNARTVRLMALFMFVLWVKKPKALFGTIFTMMLAFVIVFVMVVRALLFFIVMTRLQFRVIVLVVTCGRLFLCWVACTDRVVVRLVSFRRSSAL